MKKIELEPDEKPNERVPCSKCGKKDCRDNLFGYCQTKADIDEDGKCKTYRRSVA